MYGGNKHVSEPPDGKYHFVRQQNYVFCARTEHTETHKNFISHRFKTITDAEIYYNHSHQHHRTAGYASCYGLVRTALCPMETRKHTVKYSVGRFQILLPIY
jgi:hypothetical protein